MPVVDRIFTTFGDSDVRTIVCVPSTKDDHEAHPRRRASTGGSPGVDPDRALVDSLGLERLPAFLLLRQDTSS